MTVADLLAQCLTDHMTGESSRLLHVSRNRPTLNEEEGHRADMPISENTRLILSLEVLFQTDETIHRVGSMTTPT